MCRHLLNCELHVKLVSNFESEMYYCYFELDDLTMPNA